VREAPLLKQSGETGKVDDPTNIIRTSNVSGLLIAQSLASRGKGFFWADLGSLPPTPAHEVTIKDKRRIGQWTANAR
jgi:hypothetical protein